MKNLSKTFNHCNISVLDRITLSVNRGELIAIVGQSGSGKTTLLNVLYGLTDFEEGICKINDTVIHNLSIKEMQKFRHNYLGYVPQDYALIDEWSVYDNISLPLLFYGNKSNKEIISTVRSILKKVHLNKVDYMNRKVALLSGGEKQRVAIARALITEPQLLIADELTSALDYRMSLNIISLLLELCEAGLTIIFATHDDKLLEHCSQIIYLENGKVKNL
jgi:putative ABC transport system ATP-binding protein